MNRKPTKRMELRSLIAFGVFCAFLLCLVGNLFWLQIINGEEYRLKAEKNQLSDTVVNANRGTIYDSNMKVLAQSASAWLVYINPSKVGAYGWSIRQTLFPGDPLHYAPL